MSGAEAAPPRRRAWAPVLLGCGLLAALLALAAFTVSFFVANKLGPAADPPARSAPSDGR